MHTQCGVGVNVLHTSENFLGNSQTFGSAKTDPVRFKWGFGEGLLKDKFAFFEAYESPTPKRRKLLAKRPFLQAKRALFKNPFKLDRVSFSTPENCSSLHVPSRRRQKHLDAAKVKGLCLAPPAPNPRPPLALMGSGFPCLFFSQMMAPKSRQGHEKTSLSKADSKSYEQKVLSKRVVLAVPLFLDLFKNTKKNLKNTKAFPRRR